MQLNSFLTLTLDADEWFASCIGHFNPRESIYSKVIFLLGHLAPEISDQCTLQETGI
jgi:hypothetical protein